MNDISHNAIAAGASLLPLSLVAWYFIYLVARAGVSLGSFLAGVVSRWERIYLAVWLIVFLLGGRHTW